MRISTTITEFIKYILIFMISVMIIRDIVLAQRVKMSSISEEILELEKALDDDKYFFFPFTPLDGILLSKHNDQKGTSQVAKW